MKQPNEIEPCCASYSIVVLVFVVLSFFGGYSGYMPPHFGYGGSGLGLIVLIVCSCCCFAEYAGPFFSF